MTDNNLMKVLYNYLDAMLIGDDKANDGSSVLQLMPVAIAINTEDFSNPLTATNFEEGSSAASENFSKLVRDIPNAQQFFVPKGNLEEAYGDIISNATEAIHRDPDPEALKRYEKAFNLLYAKSGVNSERYDEYLKAKEKYNDALIDMNLASIEADHASPKGQRLWSARKRKLQLDIDAAYHNLGQYSDIKNALNTIETTFSEGINGVLAKEKKFFNDTEQTSDTSRPWHFCNAYPSNWYENEKMYIKIVINSSSTKNIKTSKYLAAGGETSIKVGWFANDTSAEYKKSEEHEDKESSVTGIEMEIASVKIERPWLNERLFSLGNWKIDGQSIGSISDGTFIKNENGVIKSNQGSIPLITKNMIIARNVKLTGKFSKDLRDKMTQDVKAATSVRIGPFKAKGHTEHSKNKEVIKSDIDESEVTIESPQIIGFISSIVKRSPKNE